MIDVMQVADAEKNLKALETMVNLRPTSRNVAELAAVYFTLGRTEEALPLARMSWERNKQPTIGMNLCLILKDLGKHDEAFRVIEEAYVLNPDDNYIRLGYGEALLRKGFWKQAWKIYDNARGTQIGAALHLGLSAAVKEWEGQDLSENDLLLVINEGGAGDRLNYARWLPELTKRGINWRFYPDVGVFSLFTRVFSSHLLVQDGDKIEPDPTFWTTSFALPAKLGITPTQIPPALQYTPTVELEEKYHIVRNDKLPIVGICYKAAEKHQGGRYVRSMTEGQALRLVCQLGDRAHFVSLQHGEKMPYPVINIPFESWEETCGLISALDEVITVDTGTFWLSSAMGKTTYLLLPANSDWKYLESGEKCYWSPNTRIFRSDVRGFEPAIDKFVAAVRKGTALKPLLS